MAEFCAGYTAIMEDVFDRREAKYRLRHFKDLMYFATRFSWTSVLTFHSACLYEIERGTKTWKSSFHKLESTTLLPLPVSRKGYTGKTTQGGPILYCAAFQRGECSHTKDHEGQFNGESRTLKHICAKCWLNEKKFATHPQTACPSNDRRGRLTIIVFFRLYSVFFCSCVICYAFCCCCICCYICCSFCCYLFCCYLFC